MHRLLYIILDDLKSVIATVLAACDHWTHYSVTFSFIPKWYRHTSGPNED